MATQAFPVSAPPRVQSNAGLDESTINRWAFWYFVVTLVLGCSAAAWVLLTV